MHCLQCGQELHETLEQGCRRASCPSCGWISHCQLRVWAGVLVEQEGRLLLVKRAPASDASPSTWSLPAGYCEADEPPTATAAREAKEETGTDIQVGRLVNAYFFDDDPLGNGLLLAYEACIPGDGVSDVERARASGGDVAATRFFAPESVPDELSGSGHDRAIRAWQSRALDRWRPGSPLRYCPHCGSPVEERQAFGRMRPVCPTCGFVHFREPKVGVSVLLEQMGRVLLVLRAIEPAEGKWSLPSGFVEWDEHPQEAALRECVEETGLILKDPELLQVVRYADDFRGPGINLTFRATKATGTLRPGDEVRDVRFFAPEELPPQNAIAFAGHAEILDQWKARRRSIDTPAPGSGGP